MNLNLQKIVAAYQAATKGEWIQSDSFILGEGFRVADCESHPDDNMPDEMQDANAEFIALAHNLFPQLLEIVSKAEGLVRCVSVNHNNEYEILEPEGVDPVAELQMALGGLK